MSLEETDQSKQPPNIKSRLLTAGAWLLGFLGLGAAGAAGYGIGHAIGLAGVKACIGGVGIIVGGIVVLNFIAFGILKAVEYYQEWRTEKQAEERRAKRAAAARNTLDLTSTSTMTTQMQSEPAKKVRFAATPVAKEEPPEKKSAKGCGFFSRLFCWNKAQDKSADMHDPRTSPAARR